MNPANTARQQLDQLFAADAAASVVFGVLALLTPHGTLRAMSGGVYNHSVHETLRCVIVHREVNLLFLRRSSRLEKRANQNLLFRFFLLFIRLYGSLRVACGWILWNIRFVDDGAFRRRVCEALFYCYVIQTLAVLRAQLTDSSRSNINWIAMLVLGGLAGCYGSFRYRKGGNLIKVYELPTSGNVV